MAHTSSGGRCPMSYDDTVDRYFMEHRAKLIDIAAFLDRLDRSMDAGEVDYRMAAFVDALKICLDSSDHRAKRVLERFSEFATDMPEHADGKGASGAPQPGRGPEAREGNGA